jgi:hypothetical protein
MSLCWPYQSVSIALSFAMRRSSTQGAALIKVTAIISVPFRICGLGGGRVA